MSAMSNAERVKKHQAEKCDQVTVRPIKGTKDRWRAAADRQGLSLQQFIIQAVEASIRESEE